MLFDCSSVALPPFPCLFPLIKTIPICSPGISFPDWLSNLWPLFLPRLESAGTQGQRWGDNRVNPRGAAEHGCTELFGVLQHQTLSAAVSILMPDIAVKEKWALGKCWIWQSHAQKEKKNDLSDIFQTVAAWVTQLSSAISSNIQLRPTWCWWKTFPRGSGFLGALQLLQMWIATAQQIIKGLFSWQQLSAVKHLSLPDGLIRH